MRFFSLSSLDVSPRISAESKKIIDGMAINVYDEDMKSMYVYIITNKIDSTLYIGVTNNLVRRIYEHKNKLIPGFSSRYNLSKLVYYEIYDDEVTAISREKQLKHYIRENKNKLISDFNPSWKDLYSDICK